MGASRLSRVQVEVAEDLVEITWDERTVLLDKLGDAAGSGSIIERFWAVGASFPVVLNDLQRSLLRVTLERWGITALPDGLARLLVALVKADPAGDIGTIGTRHSTDLGSSV
jgi:hypothetical protein